MRSSPPDDARRIFTGIGATYERTGAILSFGQDARWRARLVDSVRAAPGDVVLDVATGTGLVARAVSERYGCDVVGLDRSGDMLSAAVARNGHIPLVRARAESLPFPDESFDHLTFTYLLRYVDDPAATMRELARVVRPGGRIAALDFGVPPNAFLRTLWRAYTAIGLPIVGRAISERWSSVGGFLRGSIERFDAAHSQHAVERYWRDAGLVDVRVSHMSFGAGIVMTAEKADATETLSSRQGPPGLGRLGRLPIARGPSVASAPTAAFYALRPGGLRDYWTLLHPPYTAWHLSYVLLGAALAPMPDPRIVAGALVAFSLAVGVASHAFDELQGRPLGTRIPSSVLLALGSLALIGAVALGIAAAAMLGPWFLAIVVIGALLVISYGLELPIVHSDIGFALAWGGFPVVASAAANGAAPLPTIVAAVGATLLSLAQRRLSTPVRRIRRKALEVSGTVRFRDGATESLDRGALIAGPEAGLRLLWLAMVALSIGALAARWSG
ncbi:MAG TPA: class I SAM-dependent methyltransferase [Candidatus Bathyarchaeia archaeon]|nr:class I SAM-dependent methyltransferase [Candidatus Bathyarchaeia archaeon]